MSTGVRITSLYLRAFNEQRSRRSVRLPAGAPHRRRIVFRAGIELLEARLTPTGNMAVTNAVVVDGNGQPLNVINVGEVVSLQADFTTQDLPGDASYVVGFNVNGLTKDTGTLTWGAGGSGMSSFDAVWGGFIATPGTNQVTVSVDPDETVSETNFAD